jgi:hypothetical protein
MRVMTPCVPEGSRDPFPRSFFSDISSPAQYRRPLLEPEGQGSRKKGTRLATSFTLNTSRSTSTALPPAMRKAYQTDTNGHASGSGSGTDKSAIRDKQWTGNGELATTPKRNKEWWEVPVPIPVPAPRQALSEAADQRQKHESVTANTQRIFQFYLPEHLPTSPMCPANSRHKSGGTGVCVYHGRAKRRRTTSSISSENTPTGRSQDDENAAGSDGHIEEEEEYDDEVGSDVWR